MAIVVQLNSLMLTCHVPSGNAVGTIEVTPSLEGFKLAVGSSSSKMDAFDPYNNLSFSTDKLPGVLKQITATANTIMCSGVDVFESKGAQLRADRKSVRPNADEYSNEYDDKIAVFAQYPDSPYIHSWSPMTKKDCDGIAALFFTFWTKLPPVDE